LIHTRSGVGPIGNETRLRSAHAAVASTSTPEGLVPMTLCLIVALTPLVFAARLFEPYIAAKEILVQTGTATAALFWLFKTRGNLRTLVLTPVWIPVLFLALIGSASVLWSSNPNISFENGQYLATYMLLFAIALSAMQQAESRTALATALVLAGGIEAVYVLLQFSFGDPIFATADLAGKWQTFGTLGNPNWTGEFLAVAALVSVGRLSDLRNDAIERPSASPLARRATLAALILMLLALGATMARGAWLGFIVGSLAFVFARRQSSTSRPRLKTLILPLAGTVVAAALVILVPLLSNRESLNHLLNVKSLRGRILIWDVTMAMILDAPWIGHGLGTFGMTFPEYQANALSQPWAVPFIANASFTSYAHNDYLQLWAELGFFGLLAFGALMWIVLKRGRALAGDPEMLGCWAAVISLLINAAVAFPLHLPTTLMLFVVLVAVVECSIAGRSVVISNSRVGVRFAIVLVTLVFCFSLYRSSYDRYVSETALWQAGAALKGKRWSDAEADSRMAIRHAPTRLEAHMMLGRLHVKKGEYPQALLALDDAENFGLDVTIFDLRATALEASGQRSAAIAMLAELIRLRPDLEWPRTRLSELTDHVEENQ
jgi:O-antigen ligase